MGRLEATFKIGLAHPLLMMAAPNSPIVVNFSDTGNIVYIEPPDPRPVTEYQKNLGAFSQMVLRVRRECTDEQGRSPGVREAEDFQILSDAGKTFWMFFAAVREADFRLGNRLAGYPVAFSEKLPDNFLVRTCELEWSYDGIPRGTIPLSSHPAIQITEAAWDEARRKLSNQQISPPHVSFALDAVYYAENDPVRAIIMACAAWETALRFYLANVASKRDPAYLVASEKLRGIPMLYEFVRAARGGELFVERYGKGSDEFFNRQRKYMRQLPEWRNKLLHEGRNAIPQGETIDIILALLNATDWLFESTDEPAEY